MQGDRLIICVEDEGLVFRLLLIMKQKIYVLSIMMYDQFTKYSNPRNYRK